MLTIDDARLISEFEIECVQCGDSRVAADRFSVVSLAIADGFDHADGTWPSDVWCARCIAKDKTTFSLDSTTATTPPDRKTERQNDSKESKR